MSKTLPTERDLELAAAIGRDGTLPEKGQDQLVDALRELQAAHQATPVDERAGARIWASVERQIRAGGDRPALRVLTPMRLVWSAVSVAAAVVILILVPQLVAPADGQLVAQASATVAEYVSPDGSTVMLRPNSSLYRIDEHTLRLEGDGFFDVTHDPSRVFGVQTDGGLIEVLGTRFSVATRFCSTPPCDSNGTRVYLEEGSIRFSMGEGRVMLEPGQVAESRSGVIGPVEAGDGREDIDWMRGEVVFDSRAAGVVAAELGWHYGMIIELPEEVWSETVSGTLLLADRNQALEDFGLVLGGQFVQSGDAMRFIRD